MTTPIEDPFTFISFASTVRTPAVHVIIIHSQIRMPLDPAPYHHIEFFQCHCVLLAVCFHFF